MRTIEERPEKEIKKNVARIVRFDSFGGDAPDETLSLGYAKYACNVRLGLGSVAAVKGLEEAKVNGNLLPPPSTVNANFGKVFFYREWNAQTGEYDPIMLYSLDNKYIYKVRPGESSFERLTLAPTHIVDFARFHKADGDLVVMLDGDTHVLTYDGHQAIQYFSKPSLRCPAVYRNKLYAIDATDGQVMRCSQKGDPTEWDDVTLGARKILFSDDGGELRKTVVCGDSLYVIRDFSVFRYTEYADTEDGYSLNKVLSTQGKIYADTVSVWNDALYFYAENGFYTVKGSSVSRIWQDEATLIDDARYAAGLCFGGKYYLTARFRTDERGDVCEDESECVYNNGFLAIGIDAPGLSFTRGTDIKEFFSGNIGDKNYLFFIHSQGRRADRIGMPSEDGKIYGMATEKRWYSPRVTLGGMRFLKTIRNIHVRPLTDMKMTVILDENEFEYELERSSKVVTVPVNKAGTTFQLYFCSEADEFRLEGFEIEYETAERRRYGL